MVLRISLVDLTIFFKEISSLELTFTATCGRCLGCHRSFLAISHVRCCLSPVLPSHHPASCVTTSHHSCPASFPGPDSHSQEGAAWAWGLFLCLSMVKELLHPKVKPCVVHTQQELLCHRAGAASHQPEDFPPGSKNCSLCGSPGIL